MINGAGKNPLIPRESGLFFHLIVQRCYPQEVATRQQKDMIVSPQGAPPVDVTHRDAHTHKTQGYVIWAPEAYAL